MQAAATIPAINLEIMKTVPSTLAALSAHISAYRTQMGYDLLDYMGLVRSMLRDELAKPVKRRATMQELSRRAYNLDSIIVQGGALSSELIAASF